MSRRIRSHESAPRRRARHDYRAAAVGVSVPRAVRWTPLQFVVALGIFVAIEVVAILGILWPRSTEVSRESDRFAMTSSPTPMPPSAAPMREALAEGTEFDPNDVFQTVTFDSTNPYAGTESAFGVAEEDGDVDDGLFTMSTGGRGLAGAAGGRPRRSLGRSPTRFDDIVIVARDPESVAPSRSSMNVVAKSGESSPALPLEKTDVSAKITGAIAAVTVTQKFHNDREEAIEVEYRFPLPSGAAVTGFVLEIGGRRVLGVVKEKEEAKRVYREARAIGHAASLIEQDATSAFTERVANIAAKTDVSVRITYFERVRYTDRYYEFVFPTALAERYSNATAAAAKAPGSNDPSELQTDSVLAIPSAESASAVRHLFDLVVDLQMPFPIEDVTVATHRTTEEKIDARHRRIRVADDDRVPNRDFVLRYRLSGDETRAGIVTARSEKGTFFELLVQPDWAPSDDQIVPREITFILDTSGSMAGMPIHMAKAIITHAVENLRSGEVFNIVTFAGTSAQLFENPCAADDSTRERVARFLESTNAAGGTEMMAGLRRALAASHDPNRLQMYVFLTDGLIAEERDILAAIRADRTGARFFAFGPGFRVNRGLLDAIGEAGHGRTLYANHREWQEAVKTVQTMLDLIEAPMLTDVSVDWNGLAVADVFPQRIPDLYRGGRIEMIGRFTGPADGTAYVQGTIGTRKVRIPVAVHTSDTIDDLGALGALWAKMRIEDLDQRMLVATDDAARETLRAEIVGVATEFSLESPWTSFVAVDRDQVTGDGRARTVSQPAAALTEAYARTIGLTVENDSNGRLRVVRVDPGIAERAGLRKDDVILAIGDERPASPEDAVQRLEGSGEASITISWESGDGSRRRSAALAK